LSVAVLWRVDAGMAYAVPVIQAYSCNV